MIPRLLEGGGDKFQLSVRWRVIVELVAIGDRVDVLVRFNLGDRTPKTKLSLFGERDFESAFCYRRIESILPDRIGLL